jgi:hypothetical protein
MVEEYYSYRLDNDRVLVIGESPESIEYSFEEFCRDNSIKREVSRDAIHFGVERAIKINPNNRLWGHDIKHKNIIFTINDSSLNVLERLQPNELKKYGGLFHFYTPELESHLNGRQILLPHEAIKFLKDYNWINFRFESDRNYLKRLEMLGCDVMRYPKEFEIDDSLDNS